jgi:hypothetical protein
LGTEISFSTFKKGYEITFTHRIGKLKYQVYPGNWKKPIWLLRMMEKGGEKYWIDSVEGLKMATDF